MYAAFSHPQQGHQDRPISGTKDLVAALPRAIGTANNTLAIASIRPTQITVGFREVAEKRRRIRAALDTSGIVERRVIPVVLGPDLNHYALDRHHRLAALIAEGFTRAPVRVVADFRHSSPSGFWIDMDRRGWCRPFDAEGRRTDYSEIPSSIAALSDDPFRSLASALRRIGGHPKDRKLFSEFAWADYLRGLISVEELNASFEAALDTALLLSLAPLRKDILTPRASAEKHDENERS